LLDEGATLNIFDPKVESSQIILELSNPQLNLPEHLVKKRVNLFSDNVLEACRQAHAIVVCTEWDIFQVSLFAQINFIILKIYLILKNF